jgi:hypothetical protein
MNTIRYIITVAILTSLIVSGCVKRYDTEPDLGPIDYGTIVGINQVKALYNEELEKVWYDRTPVEITEDWAITGIVTGSDKTDGNLYKEGYLEDSSAGVLLKFAATGGFYLGDSVIIKMKGLWLGDYGDFVQIGGTPYTDDGGNLRISGFNKDQRMVKVSIDNPSHPEEATINGVKNSSFLGRLVKLENVQFSQGELGKTYADALSDPPVSANRYLEDCDGNRIIVRSSGYSTFADDLLPEGMGSITAIVTKFNTDYQLLIRDISEVQLNGERCMIGAQPLGDPVETLSEDFESFANNEEILIDGWQNLMIKGNRSWQNKIFNSDGYAQATGYNSGLPEMETWLITPPVTLSSAKGLSFQTAKAYWEHEPGNHPFSLAYSLDYNGSNFHSATWISLSATVAIESTADHTFVNSGNVALPVVAGEDAVIAFIYRGSNTESTSYRIDNINITTAK